MAAPSENDIEHRLGWISAGARAFHLGQKLEDADAEQLREAIAVLVAYQRRDELLLAIETRCDLIKALDHLDVEGNGLTVDLDQAAFRVASRLSIWLDACRMLLDRTDKRLADQFPEDSGMRRLYGELRSALYDAHWSYRLVENLRNMNHRSLPPVRASYRVGGETSGPPFVRLTRSGLLQAHPGWKPVVRDDLKSLAEDDIDIEALTREHQANLNAIILGVMYAGLGHLHGHRDSIAAALSGLEASRPSDTAYPVIFTTPARQDPSNRRMNIGVTPIESGLVGWFDDAVTGAIVIDGMGSDEELELPPGGMTYTP